MTAPLHLFLLRPQQVPTAVCLFQPHARLYWNRNQSRPAPHGAKREAKRLRKSERETQRMPPAPPIFPPRWNYSHPTITTRPPTLFSKVSGAVPICPTRTEATMQRDDF